MLDAMDAVPTYLFAFGMPGGTEWIILLVLGLLIFGRRLPEVGRSLGRGIVEFKKGIQGIEDEIEDASSATKSIGGSESRPAIDPAQPAAPRSADPGTMQRSAAPAAGETKAES